MVVEGGSGLQKVILFWILVFFDELVLLLEFILDLLQLLDTSDIIHLYFTLDMMQLRILMSGLLHLFCKLFNLGP